MTTDPLTQRRVDALRDVSVAALALAAHIEAGGEVPAGHHLNDTPYWQATLRASEQLTDCPGEIAPCNCVIPDGWDDGDLLPPNPTCTICQGSGDIEYWTPPINTPALLSPAPSTSPRSGPEMTTMTTETQQQTLTDRIDAALKATEGHTPGPWYGEDQPRTWQLFARRVEPWPDGTPIDLRDDNPEGMELHPLQILKAPKGGTPFAEYWPEPADAALIAAAPDLRALLTECMAELRAQAEALAGVTNALTPSMDTKAAYAGEFRFYVPSMDEEGEETEFFIDTPWDTIKQIMAAIHTRAALGGTK